MLIRSLLAVLLLLSPPLWAQTRESSPAPETPQTLEQANAQRARAAQMRADAENDYTTEKDGCYRKFLVNSCLVDAKKRYTQTIIDSRNLDIPARDFQREAKRADVEAQEAKRASELPLREAEQKQQAENYRSEETAKAAEREQKKAAKAQQAAAGRQKTEAEQARRQAKQEQRAKRDAERAVQKASDAAKVETKAAARASSDKQGIRQGGQ